MSKNIYHNMENKYSYEDSLSMDTGGRPEPIPSSERVKEAIRMLEVGWWEGLQMRVYYRWKRFLAFMGRERLTVGPVSLNFWYPVQVGLLCVLAIGLVLITLAL